MLFRDNVLVVCLEDSLSSNAIRLFLESIGYTVSLRYIVSGDDFLQTLVSELEEFNYAVIDGHGEDNGFFMPDLDDSVVDQLTFKKNICDPDDVIHAISKKYTSKSDNKKTNNLKLVISTACTTGTSQWSRVFSLKGCSNYIGFPEYPCGDHVQAFTFMMFQLLKYHSIYKSFKISKEFLNVLSAKQQDICYPKRFINKIVD